MGELLNFSDALTELKKGAKIYRRNWHGKGLWLELQKPDENSKMTLPYIFINIPCQNCAEAGEEPSGIKRVPWLASQTDLLAEDWDVELLNKINNNK